MYVSGAPEGHDQNKQCNILTRRPIGMERIHAMLFMRERVAVYDTSLEEQAISLIS